MKKRNSIASVGTSRARKITHDHVIELLSAVEYVHEIDKRNGNALWIDSIKKEMSSIDTAFGILEEGKATPKDCKEATVHLIIDTKTHFT